MDDMNSTSKFLMRASCVGYVDNERNSDEETTDMYRHAYIILRTRLLHNYFAWFQVKHTTREVYPIQFSKSHVCKVTTILSHSWVSYLKLCVHGFLNLHRKLK
jgi:hypothetical protein